MAAQNNTESEGYNYYNKPGLTNLFFSMIRKKGLSYSFSKAFSFVWDIGVSNLLFLKRRATFHFQNKNLTYFLHKYNKTWKNERAIEIPIFLNYLKGNKGENVLEVGNVLNHYISVKHPVLDKYEFNSGVINEDVESFSPDKNFDLIVSISTMEHVGIDDRPQDLNKAGRSLKNLQKYLTSNGKLLISFPANYNSCLMNVARLSKNAKVFCYKRIDKKRNIWKETSLSDVKSINTEPPDAAVFIEINKKTTIKF
jgi:hypothetical protein